MTAGGYVEGDGDPDFFRKLNAGHTYTAEEVRNMGGKEAVEALRAALQAQAPPARDYDLGPDYCGDRASFPLLRHVLATLQPAGVGVEFGVADGTSLGMIAAHMPAVGFDSFKGLPEQWCEYPAGSRACGVPLVENAQIVVGWFTDTLPLVNFGALRPIGLVHFDADLYSSTVTALQHIGPFLRAGCICVFDEWHRAHADNDSHEPRAWREFLETRPKLGWTVIGHDTEAWAIQLQES